MKMINTDERHTIYYRAIVGRDLLPIRGNWVQTVRRDRKRKKQEERQKTRRKRAAFYA